MNAFVILVFFICFFLIELFYFKIADKYNIIDQPNHRSSHTQITIRGGGIIFPIALLAAFCCFGFQYPWFICGLILISLISFIDDIKTISSLLRIVFHLGAVALLIYQLEIHLLPLYWILFLIIFVIGTINAVNFMDGINGITGSYGLVTVITLLYINENLTSFTSGNYLIVSIISILVFIFFNFRKKAKCFAGDVGSVSLAFFITFSILQLIIKTNNINFLLLLLVYGLDVVTTVFFRAVRKENIFKAHRSHFYQFLANERKVPHVAVSILYTVVQLIVNALIISINSSSIYWLSGILLVSVFLFLIVRFQLEGSKRLFTKNSI